MSLIFLPGVELVPVPVFELLYCAVEKGPGEAEVDDVFGAKELLDQRRMLVVRLMG